MQFSPNTTPVFIAYFHITNKGLKERVLGQEYEDIVMFHI
jgi:hypothetical protein